jgi:hypothetical protein
MKFRHVKVISHFMSRKSILKSSFVGEWLIDELKERTMYFMHGVHELCVGCKPTIMWLIEIN